jgi:RNA polymerase sigma-70 factor (ECF subfamily)
MLGDGDDAADVAQETFVRFWQSDLHTAHLAVRAKWIYQTSTRLAIDRLRRRKKGLEVRESADAISFAPGAEEALAARQWLAAVADTVPDDELEAAILSRCDAMNQNEIASVMDSSERTVRRLLSRFQERIDEMKARSS